MERNQKEGRTARKALRTDTEDSVYPVSEGRLLLRDTNLLLADHKTVSEVDLVHPCDAKRIQSVRRAASQT